MFSKGEVDRSGALWAQLLAAVRKEGREEAIKRFDLTSVVHSDEVVSWWRNEHAYPLRIVNANLRYYLRDYPDAHVTQRLKKHATIIDKLCREPRMALTQMEDIGGCRVRLPTQREVNDVVRRLKKNWTIHRHRDYVASPKPSGYRAQHLIVERKGRRVEVQLRTDRQDFWANTVEYDSRVTHDDLKSGFGPALAHDFYVAMSDLLAHEDRNDEPPVELRERLADLYDRVGPYLAGTDR